MAADETTTQGAAPNALSAGSMRIVNDAGCSMRFRVDWNGGESGLSPDFPINKSQTMAFANLAGLAPGTWVWPLIVPDGGPNNGSGSPCIYDPKSSAVASYSVEGGVRSLTVSGPTP